ncbi:MAG TPA: hypothetical protein VG389_15855 [Myxococcota bacterium]|jgi:hypothetical protein|nr:hypothetical protein [Myxococcota bacterium]
MASSGDSDRYTDPVVAAYREGIDVTLLEKNLTLTPEERFRQLMELQRLAEELRRAGRAVAPTRPGP